MTDHPIVLRHRRNEAIREVVCTVFAAVILCCIHGCPRPTPTPPPPDPGPVTCATACDRMRALGCEVGKPTQEGASCEVVCLNVQSSGVIAWDLACMSKVATCDQADACDAPPPG